MSEDRNDAEPGTGSETSGGSGSCGSSGRDRSHRDRSHRSHRRRARKERILHTRISEQLSEDIRGIADELRVPVSNLVRNVLEEAFSAAERVTDDVGDILDGVMSEAERASHRIHRFREGRQGREERFRDQMERAGEQVGRAAERFADVVDRMAQRARERASERQARATDDEGVDLRAERAAAASQDESPSPRAEDRSSAPAFPDVIAWQPVVLNTAQRCSATGEPLEPGSRVYMGIGTNGFTGRYVKEGALPVSDPERSDEGSEQV